jgi:hypothetical protein
MTAILAMALILPSTGAKMDITIDGQKVGTASVSEKITEDGGKLSDLRMELSSGGKTVVISETAKFDQDGRPLAKTLLQTGLGPKIDRKANFAGGVAKVTMTVDGLPQTKSYAAPAGSDIRAQSELWFLKTQPKPGAKVKYFRFDIKELKWVEEATTYVGPGNLKIGGKDAHAHLVKSGAGRAWVDDEGSLLRLEAGKLVMQAVR